MAGLGLEEALVRVKATILENPTSEPARQGIEEKLQGVLKATQTFQSYSEPEFMKLMQFLILAVGYARNGINNFQILSELSAVVPSDLSVNILFPVIEEDGRRRLWYYSDVISDVKIAAEISGESSAYHILMKFGRYSFFVAGIMPDILKMAERKKVVDIAYYEWAGSTALKSAAANPAIDSDDSSTLEELASDFPQFRKVLNEAGALVGTAAKKTFFDNILERYGVKGNRIIQSGPLKEKRQPEHRIGGIPLFRQDSGYEIGRSKQN